MSECLTSLGRLSCLVDCVAEKTAKVVPRISAYRPGVDEAYLPSIDEFVLYVTIRSYTTVPELMMSLVYLSRFHQGRKPPGIGRPSTPHRVFLAALMLAHEVYKDDGANKACWEDLSAIPECGFAGFSKSDVDLMESQFLEVLAWDVHICSDLWDSLGEEVCTTPSCPSFFRLGELNWACGCYPCLCLNRWESLAQRLWHCFACLTRSNTGLKTQKQVLAREQPPMLQGSAIENQSCTALDRQVEPVAPPTE